MRDALSDDVGSLMDGGAGTDAGADITDADAARMDAGDIDAGDIDAGDTDAGEFDAGDAPVTCNGGGTARTVVELSPELFSAGADPSGAAQCTDVLNPERGLFVFHDMRSLGGLQGARDDGFALIYGKVLIDDYRERDLDAALLDELTASLAEVRSAGLKVLLRFYYADDDRSPDAPLARVLAHIEQLTPLIRDNADVIAVLHPGFVGAWGEWHSSANELTEPAARKQIFDALLEALPDDRMTLSRRPSFKQAAYGGPLDAVTATAGRPLARVGHLNDCFLAGDDDDGTYQLAGERDYAIADSAFVPVGGETCRVSPPRTECSSALEELSLLHWSFLNTSYHPDVIEGLRDGGCLPAIACRLGYRFAVLGHSAPKTLAPGEVLALGLRLVNDGYARMYNPRPVELVLEGPVRRVLTVDVDPRAWTPGQPVELCLSSALPSDLPAGEYRIGLRLPDAATRLRDDPRYAVRIANASWDATTGTNLLDATLAISAP